MVGMVGIAQTRLMLRTRPLIADVLLAGGVFAVTVLIGALGPDGWRGRWSLMALTAAAFACGALIWRRTQPFHALTVATVGAVAYLVLSKAQSLVLAAPMIALYSAADTTGRRRVLTFGWLTVLAVVGLHALFGPRESFGSGWWSSENVAVIALGGLAVAAGDASRSRRAYVAAVEERARRAESEREQEARRQVTEERLRIARDLHDVVGHHVALINVQANVAGHVLDTRPGEARNALAQVRQASQSALKELQDTIWLLRQLGEPVPASPTAGLGGLAELIASFARSGLRVDVTTSGDERSLSPAVDLTAYRVIQEALTNVRKHAGVNAARVWLNYQADALCVVVDDDGGADPAESIDGGGHGLAGMRERVNAVQGQLRAAPRAGSGFRVMATLPARLEGHE